MTEESASPERLVAALTGTPWALLTLPRRARCPRELVAAVESFEAGDRVAAVASAQWLRERALDEHESARTHLFVSAGRVLAFFARSVGTGALEPDEQAALEVGSRPLPAVLLAQAARRPDAALPAGVVLRQALAAAERAHQYVGVAALMLDAYDDEAYRMWRARGFQPVKKPLREGRPRLWRALGP